MSDSDRFNNATEDTKGKFKEGAGKATGDEQLEADGKWDQTKAGAKDKVEDAKDKVSETFNSDDDSDD